MTVELHSAAELLEIMTKHSIIYGHSGKIYINDKVYATYKNPYSEKRYFIKISNLENYFKDKIEKYYNNNKE